MRNVRSHGARGDGHALDTASIQKAIDACHASGGGAVRFPPGRYLASTLFLKSGVRLLLDEGAVLLGSTDPADYRRAGPEGEVPDGYNIGALIYALDAEDISIDGGGVIDGQGPAFWTDELYPQGVRIPKPLRPHAMIHLIRCRNVRLHDIRLQNSPFYTVWVLGCDEASIDGITIDNPLDGPNTDGVDIDCCAHVSVRNCVISAGDDCIAVKSDSRRLGQDKACEDVDVSDCVLASTACGVRVGYEGDAPIRDCRFRDLVIRNTDIGIDIVSILPAHPPSGIRIRHGAQIERLSFSDIAMENVRRAFFLWMRNETGEPFGGCIRDIAIKDVTASARQGSFIGGGPGLPIERVRMHDVSLQMIGPAETESSPSGPDVWGNHMAPHGLIVQYARDIDLSDITFDWERASVQWGSEIKLREVEGFVRR